MQRSKIHRAILIAAAMLILSFGAGTKGFAQKNSPQPAKNIVLVHGAWADGSCWSKVIALLQAKGFHVVGVQNPLTSLADDVAATKRIISLQDGQVVLVGHSYAGVVITEAGNDPKVVGLVYIAAFAPGEGESREKEIITATQGQTAAALFGATVTTAAWKSKPSWAVIAGRDRAIPPELEKDEAQP